MSGTYRQANTVLVDSHLAEDLVEFRLLNRVHTTCLANIDVVYPFRSGRSSSQDIAFKPQPHAQSDSINQADKELVLHFQLDRSYRSDMV